MLQLENKVFACISGGITKEKYQETKVEIYEELLKTTRNNLAELESASMQNFIYDKNSHSHTEL
jgi:hypothetical protein